MSTQLVMYRGDDRDYTISLTEQGLPIDLTGYTVGFTCRTYTRDGAAVTFADPPTIELSSASPSELEIDPDQVGAGKGKITVHVPSTATVDLTESVSLLCDVELTDGSGKVRTAPEPLFGQSTLIKLKIRKDVTYP